jgi:16S rRNA C967 or C1407 C5-methylase (RsmB/RsmF family)/NOL1/NOP2/fmu family ribosome biogenesis protein
MSKLPQDFLNRIVANPLFGEKLASALDESPPISLRINSEKENGIQADAMKVPWCDTGFYLETRPSFTLDPHFHAGCYYPQEAGSMYIDAVLNSLELPEEPVCLDLCAAPGGKSTLIASLLKNKGVLISNEIIRTRAHILAENLTKWGCSNTLVSCNDPKEFNNFPHLFDLVLIDAPCSGEGMFRKDPQARDEWSLESAQHCAIRQQKILADVWDSVKENGYIIYSTCTFNPTENEENIAWMLENFDCEICPLPVFEGIEKDAKGYGNYFIPGKTQTEGFYCCLLQKKEAYHSNKKFKSSKRNVISNSFFKNEFTEKSPHIYFEENQNYYALTPSAFEVMSIIDKGLYWVKKGVNLGTIQKKGLQPEIDLALSLDFDLHYQQLELSKNQALAYLHGDTFALEGEFGYTVLTYQGKKLGFIKHLGNRFNNLFPKEWRIRMNIPKEFTI